MRLAAIAQNRTALAGTILALGLAAIAGAWGFQLIGGYQPCLLCLQQRIPYYLGLPVALVALVAASRGRTGLARAAFILTALIFGAGALLGTYHAGAEWGWWPGPADCGATGAGTSATVDELLDQLKTVRIVSCTEAVWRFPDAFWGLSFAGWNVVVSVAIAGLAVKGANRE